MSTEARQGDTVHDVQCRRYKRRRSPVFVDRSEVKELLGLASNAALSRYVERGYCPPPDRWLTPRRPVWNRKPFEAWLKGRNAR